MGFVSICYQQRNAHSSVLSSSGGGVFCSRCTALSCFCHSSSHFFPGCSYFILPCTPALAPDPCLLCSNTPPDLLHVLLSPYPTRLLLAHLLGPLPTLHPGIPILCCSHRLLWTGILTLHFQGKQIICFLIFFLETAEEMNFRMK